MLLLFVPFSTMAANRLATADSPYLRMHAGNPVDWYPWGDEAFEKARREGKPVFLSIGYSSCYWCRVAEETLYRDPRIAARMNAGFINVKLDREQRPDLDRLYMNATRLLGGSGGWPNNLFLTPERKPFFAGSYFPPADDDFGRPGFTTVLTRIEKSWRMRRAEAEARADSVAQAMRRQPTVGAVPPAPTFLLRQTARQELLRRVDTERGGLKKSGGSVKFPQVPELDLLLGDAKGAAAVRQTLDAMALSALRDHLGGGFHRYTIDPGWNQPHFEKMLYDNAQLLRLFATTGNNGLHRTAARETADFLLRELQDHAGGFYASLDAVSNGREGAYYLWNEEEIRATLGKRADRFLAVYRLVPLSGHQDDPAEELAGPRAALRLHATQRADDRKLSMQVAGLAPARAELLRQRASRPRPARDDKIIVAWNGLAIEALAVAGAKLREPRLIDAARKAANRLWRDAWEPANGRLRQAIFEGRPQGDGFLEDYALFGLGLLAVGQRERAIVLADAMLARFGRTDGGLAETVHAAELFAPAPESGDGPYPAGTSAAYRLLDRLAQDAPRLRARADKLLASIAPLVASAPDRWPALLASLPDKAALPVADPSAGSAGVVMATARWQGGRLVVTLDIAQGWHVNANPASFDYLIPTLLEFSGAAPLTVHYPKAVRFRAAFAKTELNVYSGTVIIEAQFGEGARPERAALRVQACSSEVCLPPADLRVLTTR
ncbi:MAG: DUF255 domain-containing protein [Rhodocyclaceae bacterium]|nr:DUF255 domain-containing protein [Rhodocyclaceae bacterium]